MSSPSKRDDALKKALEEAHRSLDPPAPAFRAIWARAEAERLGLVQRLPWSHLAWRLAANRLRWQRSHWR